MRFAIEPSIEVDHLRSTGNVGNYTEGPPKPYDGRMDTGNACEQTFTKQFSRLAPMIHEEWPEVDRAALEQTNGEYGLVVALIALETEHSKALVKKHLREISTIANDNGAPDNEAQKLRDLVDKLQARSKTVTDYVGERMAAEAKVRVEQKPLAALLTAIGLGFIIGFILRGFGRGRN